MGTLSDEVQLMVTLRGPAERMAIRRRAQVRRERVADELGVQPLAVARWERGTREPRGELRLRYARLLRMLDEIVRSAHHDSAEAS